MIESAGRIRLRLKAIGLSDEAIDAAWPRWWSDVADASPSARLELQFSLARKLGIDARSLVDEEGAPRFMWVDYARFKHLSGETEGERAAISSFGRGVGALLLSATDDQTRETIPPAELLRRSILSSRTFVRLTDLLAACWSLGLPVAYLRVFPQQRKRMAAMSVCLSGRGAILLARDSKYPANIAFYVAHEIAHLALGHLQRDSAIVDFEDPHLMAADDEEEEEADRYALELLTGQPEYPVFPLEGRYNAPALARAVLDAGPELGVEPGTLALCFGYSTQNWAVANASMQFIYGEAKPVWQEVNGLAEKELRLDQLPNDAQTFVLEVLGIGS